MLSPVSTGEPTTYLDWLIFGFWVTITVSLAAWVIALVVGSLFGILRTVPNRTLAGIGTVYVAIFRNIPLIVQSFVWYLVSRDTGITAAVHRQLVQAIAADRAVLFVIDHLSRAVHRRARMRTGALGHQRAAARTAQRGPRDGLHAMATYRYVLMPVAYRIIVPPLTSEFLNVFKNSAVASTIGLLDLSAQARQLVDYTAQTYESFIAVTLAYMLINLVVMLLMRWVEAKTRLPGYIGGKSCRRCFRTFSDCRRISTSGSPRRWSRSRCSRPHTIRK